MPVLHATMYKHFGLWDLGFLTYKQHGNYSAEQNHLEIFMYM
jgi:hypothetical protein